MNLGNAYTKIEKMWQDAQAKGTNSFELTMKSGKVYKIRHYNGIMMNLNGSFYIYNDRNQPVVGDISNTKDLTEFLVSIGSNLKK